MMALLRLGCTAALLLLGVSLAPAQHQIVCSGEAAGGYAAFPDICRLSNGELFCVFYAGYGHVSTPNDKWPKGGRIMAVRSSDNGQNWSKPAVIIDTDLDDRDPSVACLKDGTLLLNWFTLHKNQAAVMLARSTDNGKTWSGPTKLKLDSPYEFACSAPVRQLPDGSLILGLYAEDEKTKAAFGATVKSYDGGKTWKDLALIGEKSGVHLDAETDVLPLKDGKLLAALRSSKVDMHYAISEDSGKTWGPVKSFGFKGHCPYFLRHSSGVILLAHRVPATSLHWSADDGKTWNGPVKIDTVGGAYPSMVELPDGLVYCVYYEEGKGSSIRGVRLRVDTKGVKVEGKDSQILADLLMDADEKQFAVVFPKLRKHGEKALALLIDEIKKKLPADVPSSDEKRELLAKRQANAAVALLGMNQPEKVWPLLKHSADPRVRSYLIHRLSAMGADAEAIIKRLDDEPDVTIRRALVLSLGEFSEKELSPSNRTPLVPKLQDIYRSASDPGLHAAAEWLLRQWKEADWLKQVNEEWASNKEQREKRLQGIQQLVKKDKEKAPPQWYVNGQRQTMVVIPGPVEFVVGSPPTEVGRSDDEAQHKVRIGRTFAIAAKPVTLEQFLRFRKDHRYVKASSPTPDCPLNSVTWCEAAEYCNWLSEQEGIPKEQWCYEIKGNEVKLKPKYLSLIGYRLPTEAETEYATRAGTATARYYGETDELLPKYAWYWTNSHEKTCPAARLKPNELGLFDTQGNVWTWCQERYKDYPKSKEVIDDKEDELVVDSAKSRVLRGGSFGTLALSVRSAARNRGEPAYRGFDVGFRPARTLVP